MSRTKITLLSQILGLIDKTEFKKIVCSRESDKHSKGINTWTHLVSMLFMQLAHAKSLRDISNGLRSATGDLNHMEVPRAPSKSTISYMNKNRDYRVFQDLYYKLLDKYEPSLQRKRKLARRLKRKIFITDASIIPLCLKLFDWAKFRTTKGAIKLHAVLDYDTGLPNYAVISDGKKSDGDAAKELSFPSGSVLVMDRAYVDYAWLNDLDSRGVYFVTRLKRNANISLVESFLVDDKHDHILSDQNIRLMTFYSAKNYPKDLRIVKVYDEENDQILILLTNNMSWTANTISELYKARWDVEVFFKHLKQRLHVKTFVGTSANAVRIQMWTSMIAILLLKYLKNKAKYSWHLSNLTNFIRFNLFVKINLWDWIDKPFINNKDDVPIQNMTLF